MPRTIIDEVNVVVDSGQLTNSDANTSFNESSFTFELNTPVERVTKVSIDSVIIENGVYNINNDELRININAFSSAPPFGSSITVTGDVLISAGSKTHGTTFASEVATAMTNFHFAITMSSNYNFLQEKRYQFSLDGATDWRYFVWNYSQPLRLMGFNDSVVFYQSVVSTASLNLTSLVIDENNDTLTFVSEDDPTYGPEQTVNITLTHATHNINTIVYEINKGLESTELGIEDNTVKSVEYFSFSNRLIIRIDKLGGGSPTTKVWTVQNTQLAVDLKIENQATEYLAISDEPVDDSTGFEILDYSTIKVVNRLGGSIDEITIPVGIYSDPADIVTALNDYLTDIPPTFAYTFAYNTLTKRFQISRNLGGGTDILTVFYGGLARLMGALIGTSSGSSVSPEVFSFPYIPKLHTKQITITSDTLTRFRNINSENTSTTKSVIYNIPYVINDILTTNENNVKNIHMSTPKTISSIDFQMLNEEFKLINNNGGNVLINMTFYVS